VVNGQCSRPTVRFSLLIILLGIATAAVAGAPAYAADDDTDEDHELPPVTVKASHLNESSEDPSAFVETIEMDQFAGRMVSTEEVLRQAAGVNVRNFGGLGAYATVSIRGSSSDQVVVLVDGVRLNEAAGGGVDLGAIPPDQIQRIEIYRGGESALFGEGAIGGVVNIVTRDGAGGPHTGATTTYGSFNTFRVSASRADGGEQWRYYAGGSYFHTDGDFLFPNDNGLTLAPHGAPLDRRVNNTIDARNALARVGWSPSAKIDVSAHNDFYSADDGDPGLTTFPSPDAQRKLLRNLASLSLALSGLGAAGLDAKTQVAERWEWSRFRDDAGEQTGVPLVTTRTESEPSVEQTISYAWGANQLWTLLGGYRRTQLQDPEFHDPSRDSWAAALSDQVQFFQARLAGLAAIRFDDVSGVGSQWSPKAGVAGKPWEPLTLKANVGHSFRAPNFTELYFNQGVVIGNPDLKPEQSLHYDAGLQAAWLPWFFFEGAYFHNDVQDLIEYMLTGGFRYKPFNVGKAVLEGMELSLRAQWPPWLSASGGYTLTYALDETHAPNQFDMQIPGRPRHVAFGRVEGHFGPATPFVEFNYIGGNFVTEANTVLLPERKLWNMGVVFDPGGGARLGWEMKNVANEHAVDVRGFPLPGRAMYGTLGYSF
jgi:iron complex outermembrane receptor protein